MVKKITKEDLLRNRFIIYANPEKTKFRIKKPTREAAEKMFFKTLCIYVGVVSLTKRDIEGALSNANYYLEKKTKQYILDLFFPIEKDNSLNSLF